jgi:hypothetical protein
MFFCLAHKMIVIALYSELFCIQSESSIYSVDREGAAPGQTHSQKR